MGQLNELCQKAYNNAKEKGFYDKPTELGTRLMLIVSELAEAMEADRHNKWAEEGLTLMEFTSDFTMDYNRFIKGTVEEELADTFIRLFDLCGYLNIDIEKHIELKMRYNSLRPYKHGKKY